MTVSVRTSDSPPSEVGLIASEKTRAGWRRARRDLQTTSMDEMQWYLEMSA